MEDSRKFLMRKYFLFLFGECFVLLKSKIEKKPFGGLVKIEKNILFIFVSKNY